MHPRKLDDDGVVSGHMVKEGDPLGMIGNFNRRPGWTTTHLHFEVLVPTRDGWVRVNPYMTLVAAYEQLIHARGTEIEEPASDTPAETPAETQTESSDDEASAASAAVPATAKLTTTVKPKSKAAPRARVKARKHKAVGKARGRPAHLRKKRGKKRR